MSGLLRMSREEYDALDMPSWSGIKPVGRSPAHALQALKAKRTKAFDTGLASHSAVLEPEEFSGCAVWRGGVRRGKEWDAFRAANEGRTILTEDEWQTASSVGRSVREHPIASRYLSGGQAEATALWAWQGIECKSRLDYVSSAVVELKSTVDASPRGFGAQVARLDYLGQGAMYVDAHEAVTGERLPLVFIAVEKESPYVVQVYRVPEELMLIGRGIYQRLLTRWAECRRANSWPGYSNEELALKLPTWAYSEEWTNGNGNADG